MSRGRARTIVALLALGMPSCVPSENVTIAFDSGRFNEKIRGDFGALTPDDLQSDPKFGFFRDSSGGGVVSEIFPQAPTSDSVSGRLVESPCLFVGQVFNSRWDGDELRIGWELIGDIDRSADENLERFFQEHHEELGLCTLSSPIKRLLFERPDAPLTEGGLSCGSDGDIQTALTLNRKDPRESANIPGNCVIGHGWPEVVLEAFSPPVPPDPDVVCPRTGSHFTDRPVTLGDSLSACGFPVTGVDPTGDASYRLSLRPGHSFGSSAPERWMSPNVMFVNGGRDVVRPMTADGGGGFRWQTPVMTHPRRDADKQWEENYMPTLLVSRVEILSRDQSGGERNETPFESRLRILVPNPSGGADSVVCTGRVRDTKFSFAIPDDCGIDNVQLRSLTPTYAPAHLRGGGSPVTTPITWSVSLAGLPPDRTAFIRFALRVEETLRGALRISPAHDFGTLQVNHWRQGTLLLSNDGGPDVEVRSVGYAAGSRHPRDFSFVVAGDPRMVPLPIEAVPGRDGVTLQLSADASDAPIVKLEEDGAETVHVSLGDPARGSGTEPLTVYGQAARLVGGLFLRDDPAAVLAPAAPPYPRPLGIRAFAERRPPFLLGRNETAKIVVTARPTATGARSAGIQVEAVPIGDPTRLLRVISQVQVAALSGPQLHGIPEFLVIGSSQYRDDSRFAMLENVGYFDLRVTRLSITGRHPSRFALATSGRGAPPSLPFTLVPGGFQDLQIVYTPECDGSYSFPDHEASLMVESNGGNWQLPLYGYSYHLCP